MVTAQIDVRSLSELLLGTGVSVEVETDLNGEAADLVFYRFGQPSGGVLIQTYPLVTGHDQQEQNGKATGS